MTASTVWINGQKLGEYKGGYTPFSFDLTPPIDEAQARALRVDDTVTLQGTLFGIRDATQIAMLTAAGRPASISPAMR
jgi:hypothetical protein